MQFAGGKRSEAIHVGRKIDAMDLSIVSLTRPLLRLRLLFACFLVLYVLLVKQSPASWKW